MKFHTSTIILFQYVNPSNPPAGIGTDDPRWIGAWWLGAVIIAIPLAAIGPILTLFPEKIPTNSKKQCDADIVDKQIAEKPLQDMMAETKDFFGRILRNKVYVANLFSVLFKV